jgi:hypothetical protein
MLSGWQTVSVALGVALLTAMLGPYALAWFDRLRQRKVARRLIAHEIQRLRMIVHYCVEHDVEGGWSERVHLDPPLPMWEQHRDVLADALSHEAYMRVAAVYDEWDVHYIVFGQSRGSLIRRSLERLVELADVALADLGTGKPPKPRLASSPTPPPAPASRPEWAPSSADEEYPSSGGTANPPT